MHSLKKKNTVLKKRTIHRNRPTFFSSIVYRRSTILFLAITVSAFAAKMDKELHEAVYQFELKGNFAEAQDMLSRISLEGDDEDKRKAFFLLGKIQEVSENPQTATFYYRQALANPQKPEDAYFLADRIALLDSTPERIVLSRTKFSAPIRKTFSGNSPSILLTNNQLYSLRGDKFLSVPMFIPAESKIFDVSSQGIWYSSSQKNTLHFQPKDSKQPVHSYPFNSEIISVHSITGMGAMVSTDNDFAFVTNEGFRFSIENRYRGCEAVGLYSPKNEFILNCQDNALHFLDAENGNEKQTFPMMDPIQRTILTDDGIFVSSSNTFWHFRPQSNSASLWENKGNPIEDATFFGNKLAILESGGKLKLLDPNTGHEIVSTNLDGETLFEMASGALGVFSQEGALTVVDTNLHPLWSYHFGKPLISKPLKNQGEIFLPFENNEVMTISALHYGKKPILSQQFAAEAASEISIENWKSALVLIDSAKALEPGNPTANYLQAVHLERIGADEKIRASAWSNAVRYSFGDSKASPGILAHYAKIIDASFVHFLPLSPRTQYPRLFNAGHGLFTIDPAAQTLFALDPSSGAIRWSKDLGNLETSPVIANDASHLAIANGFRIQIFDLSQNGKSRFSDLPGKPFLLKFSGNSIYVSTWNGYFIKLIAPDYRIAWARKLLNLPFLFDISKTNIAIAGLNLEGSLGYVNDATGQNISTMTDVGSTISLMELSDSLIAVATEKNEIRIYNESLGNPQHVIQTDAALLSLKWVTIGSSKYLLAGMANQKIRLFGLTAEEPLWTYSGNASIYSTPIVNGNSLYIDQKSHIAKISLSKGTLEKKFATPGGAGSPFIFENTLFCTSPKRLLYAFPIR